VVDIAASLDLLHCAGSVASNAEERTEIETAISRNRDPYIACYPSERGNTPAFLALMVDDDGLDETVSCLIVGSECPIRQMDNAQPSTVSSAATKIGEGT
jgi:hypothetical protein